MQDVILKNGTVVFHDRIETLDVHIKNELIHEIGSNLNPSPHTTVLDCSGKYIFPGTIDPHTHMGIPIKHTCSADNFETGSNAAINGGVTTIIDFSILKPDQTLSESIIQRRQDAKDCLCDYKIHCTITHVNQDILAEIPELIKSGVISFKVFTTYREAGMMLSWEEIRRVSQVISDHNGILLVHAEDDSVLTDALESIPDKNSSDPTLHAISRPDTAEEEAIKRLSEISGDTGCRIYIVHLSSAKGLDAAAVNENLIVETCPQYLFLDDDVYNRDDGRMYVASPSLKSRNDATRLLEALLDGRISTVGTDHCPLNIEDKPEDSSFLDIPNGIGGVETLMPVLLAHFIQNNMDLTILNRITSYNAAKIFSLFPSKGHIEVGADADICVYDPEKVTENWQSRSVSTVNWSAWSEFPALFPDQVFRRGEWLVKDGLRV